MLLEAQVILLKTKDIFKHLYVSMLKRTVEGKLENISYVRKQMKLFY